MKLKKNKFIIGLSTTVLGSALAAGSQVAYADEPVDISSGQSTGVNEIIEPSQVNFSQEVDGSDLVGEEKSVENPTENDSQAENVDEANADNLAEGTEQNPNGASTTNETEKTDTAENTDQASETTSEEEVLLTEPSNTTEAPAVVDEAEEPLTEPTAEEKSAIETDQNQDIEVEAGAVPEDGADTASTAADSVDEDSTEKPQELEANTESLNNKETADATSTEQKDEASISADTTQETPAGDEPLKEATEAGDAPLDEDGVPKTEEASELPEIAEGAELPSGEDSEQDPKIQTFAAGDEPLTEEGAQISPGESVKDSEQKIKNADAYNIKPQEVPQGYKKVNDAVSYRITKANTIDGNPNYFGVSIIVDTTHRVIDDLAFTDSFNISNKIDVSSIMFKSEGESLARNDKVVNFKPTSDPVLKRFGQQYNLNYTMSPEDLKVINDRKGETVLAFSGRYITPPSTASQFGGSNSSVDGHLIAYPNENNDGDIISVDTGSVNNNEKLIAIPVTEESPNHGIENGVYDTGITIDNINQGDKNRITGRVYTRKGQELDDVRVFYDGNSVKLKLPEGALKDENSIFNKSLEGYKDLEVELFIRPRTGEEISNLYKDYMSDFGADPTKVVVPNLKSGSKTITNEPANDTGTDIKTETLDVNTYNRVRYDNFNTLGRFEIFLDDQSNYDVTFWKDGKDTTDKVNRLTAGKTSTIEERYNAYKSELKSDLDAALFDEIAEKNLDKSNLIEVGENIFETEDGWKVEIDEEAKTYKITPSLNAEKGDEISLSVEFKFTNGSTKDFPLIFRVNKEVIETPKYETKVDEPNTTVTSTPSYDADPDTVAPNRIELNSRYNVDDHGNLWEVSIDETGQITAKTPYEVNGEYTLRVPVTAYYKDPVKVDENGKPIEYIRKTYAEFTTKATKEYERTYTETEPVPYKVEIQQDPNLEYGKEETVRQGKNGSKEVTYKQQYNSDGTKNGGPSVEAEKTTTDPVTHIIKVGTKTEGTKVITEDIAFNTKVEYDPKLKKGEWKYKVVDGVEQKGVAGERKITVNIENSVATSTTEQVTAPVDAVILVGNDDFTGSVSHEVTEEIPFTVTIEKDPNMKIGDYKVETEGKAGSKTTKYTQAIKNGQADGELVSEEIQDKYQDPTNAVIKVGSKPVKAVTEDVNEEIGVTLDFQFDKDLDKGKYRTGELVKGKVESVVTTTFDPETGEMTSTETRKVTDAKQTIYIGSKGLEGDYTYKFEQEIPFEVKYVDDPTLDAGTTKVDQPGSAGTKTVTVTAKLVDGKAVEDSSKVTETVTTKATDQIVKVGTKTVSKVEEVEIPYTSKTETDTNMSVGETRVVKGQTGKKTITVTTTRVDGQTTTTTSEEVTIKPTEEVVYYGTKPVVQTQTVETPYTTKTEADPNMAVGETNVETKGQPGKKTITITTSLDKNGNTQSVVSENVDSDPVEEVIKVGTKVTNGNGETTTKVIEIPYETEVKTDDTLAKGERVIDQKGEKGERTITVTTPVTNGVAGEPVVTDEVTKDPVKEIIIVGTKCDKPALPETETFIRSEKIPFGRKIIEDDSLAAGTYKIVQEGKAGSKEITYTLKDGKVINEKLVSEVPAQDLIIHIGTKKTSSTDKPTAPSKPTPPVSPTTQTITREVPYDTVFIYDNTIEAGKKVVTSPGQKGEKIVTITSKLVDGKIVTQTTEEITKQPKTEYVRIGTKAPKYSGDDVVTNESKVLIPFETEIIYDDTLPLGQTEVVREGRDGIQVVTITTRYQNGLVVDTTRDGYVEREAINKVVRIGTKTDAQSPTIDENTGIVDIPTTTEDNDHIIVIPEGAVDDENHVVVIPEEATDDADVSSNKNRPDNDDQVDKSNKNKRVSEDDTDAGNIKRSAVSSTNPKTGITGTAGIISTLGISLAGIAASRKKKENDEE